MTPADLLRSAMAADASRPLVTFYDDATGERTELSVATFDNWVAKTANLLQDGLLAEPGQRVAILLPLHWQTAVWLLSCWTCGLVAAPGGDPAGADVAVAGPETVDRARACPGERVALALRPLAGRFAETPPGFLDYAAEVPGYGDRFVPYTPPDAGATALEVEGRTLTGDELTARARERADHLGLGTASRVLSTTELMTWDGLLEGLLAPLAAGASVVLCRNADPAALAARITGERVTTVTG